MPDVHSLFLPGTQSVCSITITAKPLRPHRGSRVHCKIERLSAVTWQNVNIGHRWRTRRRRAAWRPYADIIVGD